MPSSMRSRDPRGGLPTSGVVANWTSRATVRDLLTSMHVIDMHASTYVCDAGDGYSSALILTLTALQPDSNSVCFCHDQLTRRAKEDARSNSSS